MMALPMISYRIDVGEKTEKAHLLGRSLSSLFYKSMTKTIFMYLILLRFWVPSYFTKGTL